MLRPNAVPLCTSRNVKISAQSLYCRFDTCSGPVDISHCIVWPLSRCMDIHMSTNHTADFDVALIDPSYYCTEIPKQKGVFLMFCKHLPKVHSINTNKSLFIMSHKIMPSNRHCAADTEPFLRFLFFCRRCFWNITKARSWPQKHWTWYIVAHVFH